MTERYGAENERSAWMRFHTQTAGVSLTPQQPLNNLTRVAVQALAAVLGGTQSLHTDAHDEALAVPTAEAALLALRQQQIIAEETGVDATVDPLGGSWFVEALTDETERAVWRYLDEIDRRGGMVAAITEGYPQREIADAAYRYQREFDAGERRVVGVNAYVDEAEVTSVPGAVGAARVVRGPDGSARADAPRARCRGRRAPRCAGLRDAAAPARIAARRTSCRTSSAAPRRTPRSASSARSCARSSASTASPSRSRPARPRRRDYHAGMYLDALEFLEEERDAWRPYEALAEPDRCQLERAGRGRPRLVRPRPDGPHARLAGVALEVAKELAVNETSPTIARVDADWDARGGEVVNAEIQAAVGGAARWPSCASGSGRSPASCAAT